MDNVNIFLHSVNTGTGGGATLLNELILALSRYDLKVMCQLDSRIIINNKKIKNFKIFNVKPNIFSRIKSEFKIKHHSNKYDLVICFGSLPPLFHIKGKVIIFVQNRYLVDRVSLQGFKLSSRVKIFVERLWLKYRHKKNYKYVVQTESMRSLLAKKISIKTSEILKQSLFSPLFFNLVKVDKNAYDFIYVASGEPHKNHRRLLEAWVMLAKKNIYPSLCITLDPLKFKLLLKEITDLTEMHKLKIFNAGNIPLESINLYYASSKALIYPSLLESFGLPLIEAENFSLPILASELDYVRDVVVPAETFDPYSALSISRAVMRYLHVQENKIELVSGEDFIKNVYKFLKS